MKLFNISIYLLLFLGVFMFSSCEKENVDDTNTEEEEVIVQEVICETAVLIAEQPPGSGDLFTSVTDGTAPYTYEWSTGETTSSINVAEDGTYSVTVTDAADCTAGDTLLVTLNNPCENFQTVIQENTINVLFANSTSGTTPYSYNWSTGETTSSINVSDNGTYSVTVEDANGCVSSGSYDFVFTDPCESFMTVIEENTDGVLLANTTGGTATYNYLWSTGETSASISVSIDGTYSVTVEDANGCVTNASYDFVFTDPCSNLIVTIENPQATTLFTQVSGGTEPYARLWSTGETSNVISAPIAEGTYSVTVTDANGCTAENEFEF